MYVRGVTHVVKVTVNHHLTLQFSLVQQSISVSLLSLFWFLDLTLLFRFHSQWVRVRVLLLFLAAGSSYPQFLKKTLKIHQQYLPSMNWHTDNVSN